MQRIPWQQSLAASLAMWRQTAMRHIRETRSPLERNFWQGFHAAVSWMLSRYDANGWYYATSETQALVHEETSCEVRVARRCIESATSVDVRMIHEGELDAWTRIRAAMRNRIKRVADRQRRNASKKQAVAS